MGGRVGLIADAMKAAMGRLKTHEAMALLVGSMPPLPKAEGGASAETDERPIASGYRYWPYGEFIGRYGLDDVDASFEAMVELTQRFGCGSFGTTVT
jgi:hypothetical protein